MSLDEALQTFVAESAELLEQMEEALLRIELQPDDAETINAIFRAAHTIKGSAGVFGLDDVVAFTHVAESVLDEVRRGELCFNGELASLFLLTCDQIRRLVDLAVAGRAVDAETAASCAALVQRLRAASAGGLPEPRPASVGLPGGAASTFVRALPGGEGTQVHTDNWHLSLRFGPDTLRQGFDPLAFLRYLRSFGEIVFVATLTDAVPRLAALEADSCHLGFEVSYRSEADKATIEAAFEFVQDDSLIRILPPRSKMGEYIELLHALPESPLLLGEMLTRCGSLTEAELARALALQNEASADQDAPPPPLGEVLLGQGVVRPDVVEAALHKQQQVREARQAEANFVRVDAAKLDQLIDLVGELIIAGTGASLVARQHRIKELVLATTTVARLVESVRDSALKLRMVAIGGTFNRFQRVVRDVSRELGKDIELQISGADTELDKTVVERIADPLTHLVRNAIDHGIGLPEARIAKGKPARGTVRLNAYHDAGSVVIEVGDDGSGLKTERIVARAIERGLIPAQHTLSHHEVHQLIFEPGFSTAAAVSNLSGRGVGMDVVKRNITALRGSVDLYSEPGEGTTVRIRLPLTLAIIDGFLVAVGDARYVLPLDMVVECLELRTAQAQGRDYLDLRGEVLPLVRLREVYGIEGERGRRENVVVVQGGGQRAGLVVDQLLGELQTVIKPLGRVFQGVPGVGGFTILGNGAVALLLDVPQLVAQVARLAQRAVVH